MCKLGQKFELSRINNQSENGQATYHIPMNTQFGRRVNQTYEVLSREIIPISRLQTIYTTLIMMTQANRFVGGPPSIPSNCE
jgi:hypothetical protein